ncbi:MAG TPA: hypothetical protein VKU90_07725 [Caulobacteraceae bacterium]|nr:hypothetical protein [Caulobacteraceae bacterium]
MPDFDYLQLTLQRGAAARRAFVDRVRTAGLPAGRSGLFASQLGWEAAQMALLAEAGVDFAALTAAPEVVSHVAHRLSPTLRPRGEDVLKPGGVYVHRWFEIDRSSLNEFVDLSGQAWPEFEGGFDANIFGLFLRAPEPADADGRAHLLLVTRYADHGVWEASRDPSPTARQAFMRRHELTHSTRAASTLLVAP